MHRLLIGLVALLAFGPALWGDDQPKDAKTAPEKEYQALVEELKKAVGDVSKKLGEPKSEEDQRKVFEEVQKVVQAFSPRFLAFAEKHPKDDSAVDALTVVLLRGQEGLAGKATELLIANHADSAKLSQLVTMLGEQPRPGVERLLRAVRDRATKDEAKATATLSLAKHLKQRVEGAASGQAAEAAKLSREAEALFTEVAEKYAKVGDLAETAKNELFELRFLSVGKTAPDIEGEDGDGKKFKLSDYRGKVVVLDFWAGW
jgi:AhpC/TSA family